MTPSDIWRRRIGLALVGGAFLMTVLGLTLLTTRLTGLAFITYWLACGALVLLALGTAALDMLVMSARGREERQQLAREADPGTPGTERAAAVQQAAEE